MILVRLKGFVKRRPNEVAGTAIGAISGVPIGALVGGIGVAAMGGAIGIPAIAVCSAIGAAIGNRIGVGLDRPLIANQPSSFKDADE